MDEKTREEIRRIAQEQDILIREARLEALARIEEAARTLNLTHRNKNQMKSR